MSPKFTDLQTWQQADMLMQPVMIRLVDNLRKQVEQLPWQSTYQAVDTPIPGYRLSLSYQDHERSIDIWELCYAICFQDYQLGRPDDAQLVQIDRELLDAGGDVDWHYLDNKAQRIVEQSLYSLTQDWMEQANHYSAW